MSQHAAARSKACRIVDERSKLRAVFERKDGPETFRAKTLAKMAKKGRIPVSSPQFCIMARHLIEAIFDYIDSNNQNPRDLE
jgi:hypothetical protein